MTTFPTLTPSTRTYSPGAFPHTAHRVYDGSESRVRHSNTVLGVRLRLFFPALTTAELLTVIAHYNGQRGRFLPFTIPNELLSGTTTPATFTPAGHQWRYAAKPTAEDVSVNGATPSNLHNLTVELETVPPENTITPGVRLRVRSSLRAGSAQLGEFFDVLTQLDAGSAAVQLDLTAVASLDAGSPFPVVRFEVVATIETGAAVALDLYTVLITLEAGAPSFDVLALSPLAWWDASDASTITLSGGAITDWNDKSGNGWHLTQATASQRPTIDAASINGLDAALWPSGDNDDFLQTAAGTFTTAEFYYVAKFANADFSNYEGTLNPNSSADGWTTGTNTDGSLFFGAGKAVYLNGNNTTNRNADMRPDMSSTCLFRFLPTSPLSTTAGVVLGTDRNNAALDRGWNGHICEVVAFSSVLSADDRGALEDYLMARWNV